MEPMTATPSIVELLAEDVVLGDGGYLIELERRGYVDSGSGREKVGTGRGSGQFTPEVAIETPRRVARAAPRVPQRRLAGAAGAHVLRHAREAEPRRLRRADRSDQRRRREARQGSRRATERSWPAACRARSSSSAKACDALGKARDHIAEQIRLLKDAGVDFLILETFFHLAEMKVALEARRRERPAGRRHDELSPAGHAMQRRPHARPSARG